MISQEIRFWTVTRQDSASKIDPLSQAQIGYSPRSGVWSVGEVIDHVLRSEALYRREFQELIAMAKAGTRPVISRDLDKIDVGLAVLPKSVMPVLDIPLQIMNPFVPQSIRNTIIRSRLIRARHPQALTPQKGRSREVLLEDLESSFQKTLALFDDNPGLDYSRMIHKHPMIGVNTVPQLIRIAALHEQRHQEQIQNMIESPGFPSA